MPRTENLNAAIDALRTAAECLNQMRRENLKSLIVLGAEGTIEGAVTFDECLRRSPATLAREFAVTGEDGPRVIWIDGIAEPARPQAPLLQPQLPVESGRDGRQCPGAAS